MRVEQEKTGLWSAYDDERQLASSGETREEAEGNLRATVAAYERALSKRPR